MRGVSRRGRAAGLVGAWLLVAAALPSRAAVPDDTVVLTRAATVEAWALPPLLALPGGTFSSLDLTEAFHLGVWFETDDILALTVGAGPAERIDPTTFVLPVAEARYFDPALGDTRPATVIASAAAGGEAVFDVEGRMRTLTQLLRPSGALLAFPPSSPVPEPSVVVGLLLGTGGLILIGRRAPRS